MGAETRHIAQRSSLTLAFVVGVLLAGSLGSQPAQGGGRDEQPPRKPPKEALGACAGHSAGQACSFTGRRGAMEGTCFAPADRPLACRPANAPEGKLGGHRPEH